MKGTTTEEEKESGRPEDDLETGKMSFLEHLDELRRRLVRIIIYLAIGFCACLYFCKEIYRFISIPITKAMNGAHLVYTNPTDPFTMYMKVAMIAGVFLTVPFSLYEIWKFIAPGLYRNEKKYVVPFMASTVFLFLAGGAFCYYFVLSAAYTILLQIGSEFTPMITINEYLDLTLMMILGFGLIFEMPVIVAFLSMFGLVSAGFLWRKSKYSIVIMVTIAAILSPTGDAVNLLIWSAPMIVLYFLSIGVAYLFGRQRKKKGKFLLWE